MDQINNNDKSEKIEITEKIDKINTSENNKIKSNYFVEKFNSYKKRKEEKLNKKKENDKKIDDLVNHFQKPINNIKATDVKPLEENIIDIKKSKKHFFSFLSKKNKADNAIASIISEEEKKLEKDKKPVHKKEASNKELYDKKNKKQKITFTHHERKRHLKDYLEKAGYSINDEELFSKNILFFGIFLSFLISLYFLYLGIVLNDNFILIFVKIIFAWTVILPFILVLFWTIFYFVIDFKIYNRRKQVEEVLPDFLQLASANLNAGMPIDQALWFAVRPRFGILSKEIEEVAKSTIVGEDLGPALIKFSNKYDSVMLKRTVNLILEGLDAGGKIGPLLSKISIDIQETRILRKDMAANVTTYVIFISAATLFAAPFLFALSGQLLSIIQSIVSNINIPQGAGGMSMSFSSSAISMRDFNIFAIATLTVTAFFSAVIVSTIKYGNVKDGIKYIPIYIAITVILYLILSKGLGYFLGGIF